MVYLNTTNTLERSWLVQRLTKPRDYGFLGGKAKDNPFSFGGGLKNGGLSDKAMDLTRGIWSYDYMGAAEFEFGAVPEALRAIAGMADKNELVATTMTVDLSTLPKRFIKRDKQSPPDGEATIYLLVRNIWADEVAERIRGWVTQEFPDLKEALLLDQTLWPTSEWHGNTQGWLELNNGFMFFADKEMWEKVCTLFGVKEET
jgi:hypothetical protein